MAESLRARRTEPSIPATDPRFVWTNGADVQATWRRHGWTPPSAGRPQFTEPPRQFTVPRVRWA